MDMTTIQTGQTGNAPQLDMSNLTPQQKLALALKYTDQSSQPVAQGFDKNGAYSPMNGIAQLFQGYQQNQQNQQKQQMIQQLLGGQPAQQAQVAPQPAPQPAPGQ